MTVYDAAALNEIGKDGLPAHLGIDVVTADREHIALAMPVRQDVLSPLGFLHSGVIVTMADTACAYGTINNLPQGANGYTTIEMKSNFLYSVFEGMVACVATPVNITPTTQIWDAIVTSMQEERNLAVFRCTQMILYPY